MDSRQFNIRISGALACFTRPEFSTERVSYEVITPSAARGVIEAVLWKPAIRWNVHRIVLLRPVRWLSFRRNEVNSRASTRNALRAAMGGAPMPDYFADEDRAQRNTLALRDVDYGIVASFAMTARAGERDNVRKFEDCFERRLLSGKQFMQPYLGCREFAATVEPWDGAGALAEEPTRDLGWMLHDIRFGTMRNGQITNQARFFPARLHGGVIDVPAWEQANGGTVTA